MRAVTIAPVSLVPIDQIVVGERRREKSGKIQSLANSIKVHGLIHPILLRGNTLIAGFRRLEACRLLEWQTVPARQVHEKKLTDADLRALELVENTARENLSDYAASKARLAEIRQSEAELKAKAKDEANKTRPKSGQVLKRGPARTAGSKRDIAEAIGVSKTEQQRIERHVAIAERYPFMQRAGWVRPHVLEAGAALERIPEDQRTPLAALLDQDAIPPKEAVRYLQNLATFSDYARREIIALARSDDPHVRTTALTSAALLPPPVDPGLSLLSDAVATLQKAARSCRTPEFKVPLTALVSSADELLNSFKEANRHAREEWKPLSVTTPLDATSRPS